MSVQVEMMSVCDFNASVYVSEQLNRQLVNMSQDLAYRCVGALAERYNFDADEANRLLGLGMIKVERKVQIKAKGSVKAAKVSVPKAAFPLPYNGEFNDACCYGLRQNNGLYTQCTGVRRNGGQFCKGCATLMQKTGAEVPEYGTIQQRMAVDIFEYTDPKGRKPIAYTKVMKKYKITKEQVLEEAGKYNIIVNPNHFVASESDIVKRGRPKADKEPKAKGAKGRPKKEKKVLMVEGEEDEDLFAALVANSLENADEEDVVLAPKTDAKKKAGKTDEEKESEKESKRLAAELAKKEKDEKLAAEKQAKLEEKELKKEVERLAREEKKKAEEAEKLIKKEVIEFAKKQKAEKLAAEKEQKKEAAKTKKPTDISPVEEEEEPDVVKKIEFEGKKYLKSKKSGIIYDYNEYVKNGEQVVVGKWNDTTNKIDFAAAAEEEEEQDEYEE